jgi:dipeptide/tripeptide permease
MAGNGEKPFWKSVKFYYALLAIGAFLALVLTGTLTVTTEQAMNFILTVFGFNVGAHALTNISAVIGQFFGRNGQAPVEEEPDDEDEEDEEEDPEEEEDDEDGK